MKSSARTGAIIATDTCQAFVDYLKNSSLRPIFICGDAYECLKELPHDSVDFCMTSPAYWGQRQYSQERIGLERHYREYIDNLCLVFQEVYRVLKRTGSFWLNIGDTYLQKHLLGCSWGRPLDYWFTNNLMYVELNRFAVVFWLYADFPKANKL